VCTKRARTIFFLPDWRVIGLVPGVVLPRLGVEVVISVVTELCEHPGAEDGAQAGLGQVDLSVRVLAKMRIGLLGHGDLGAQGGQDRHLGAHGRGVGNSPLVHRLYDTLPATADAAHRAHRLDNLSVCLSALGRRHDALIASTQAVETYRRLAAADCAAFEPDLARGLWVYARVRAVGRVELPQALTAGQESVALFERLLRQRPPVFTGDLRGALATVPDVLEGLGRGHDADGVRHRIDALQPAEQPPWGPGAGKPRHLITTADDGAQTNYRTGRTCGPPRTQSAPRSRPQR
jgi:hypothetical protein